MKKESWSEKYLSELNKWSLDSSKLKNLYLVTFDPREMILQEGDINDPLMIIISGKAKACSTSKDGKNLILSYYVSSGIIGDIEFGLQSDQLIASMYALSEFRCIAIPIKQNAAYLRGNIDFMNQLAYSLSKKLVESSNNFLASASYTGEQRLCYYLLHASYKNFFADNLTDTAATVGLSYRHMFRLLNKLCDDRVIKKAENGYEILDLQQLEERA